jgi:hypothetical protein
MGGESVLFSPPPEPSPIKGEGSYEQATRMKFLPLSASGRGKKHREESNR